MRLAADTIVCEDSVGEIRAAWAAFDAQREAVLASRDVQEYEFVAWGRRFSLSSPDTPLNYSPSTSRAL